MTADLLIEVEVGIAVDIVNGGWSIYDGVKMYMPMLSNAGEGLGISKPQNGWQWLLTIVWMRANPATARYLEVLWSLTSFLKP